MLWEIWHAHKWKKSSWLKKLHPTEYRIAKLWKKEKKACLVLVIEYPSRRAKFTIFDAPRRRVILWQFWRQWRQSNNLPFVRLYQRLSLCISMFARPPHESQSRGFRASVCVDLVFLRESTFSGREELDLWSRTFMTNIKEIGRVVLVALPFHSQTSSIDPRLMSIGSL